MMSSYPQSEMASQVAAKVLQKLGNEDREKLLSELSNVGVVNRSAEKDSKSTSYPGNINSKESSTLHRSTSVASQDEEIIVVDSDDDVSSSSYTSSSDECSDDSDSSGLEEVESVDSSDERDFALPKATTLADEPEVEEIVQEVESDEDEDADKDWDVITIEDDEPKEKRVSKTMVCLRCPTTSMGTFKDKNKFFIHVKRHLYGEIFSCPTCRRPFTKIHHCLSHEIRVHGTKIVYDSNPVISFAKKYVLKKEQEKKDRNQLGQGQGNSGNAHTSAVKDEADDDTDSEDPKFYNNQITASTCLYPYWGPEVKSMLEAYEIQVFHARPKYSRANYTARIALDIHKQNIEKNQDVPRLGRFSTLAQKNALYPKKKKSKSKTGPKKSAIVAPAPTATRPPGKRPRDEDSDGDACKKPKKKRQKIVYKYITSSSSSSDNDDSDDADYIPSKSKKGKVPAENTSGANKGLPSTSTSKPRKSKTENEVTMKKCLPALMKRVCMKCAYMWNTEVDLREHRDLVHPNVPLLELVTMQVPVKVKSPKKVSFVDSCVGAPPKKKKGKKKLVENAKLNGNGKVAALKKKTKSKLNAGNGNKMELLNPAFPYPLSEKEKLLHGLGLMHNFRYLKKPITNLKLPDCVVKIKRLGKADLCKLAQSSSH